MVVLIVAAFAGVLIGAMLGLGLLARAIRRDVQVYELRHIPPFSDDLSSLETRR